MKVIFLVALMLCISTALELNIKNYDQRGQKMVLQKGESLVSNTDHDSLDLGKLETRMQSDGNLVTYKHKDDGYDVMWSSGTAKDGDDRHEPYTLLLQGDDNLVIYDGKGNAVWASNDKTDKWNLGHEGWFWLELRKTGAIHLCNAGDGTMWKGLN